MTPLRLRLLALLCLLTYIAAAHEKTQDHGVAHRARAAQRIKRSVPNLKPLDAKRRLLARRSYAHEAVSGELTGARSLYYS